MFLIWVTVFSRFHSRKFKSAKSKSLAEAYGHQSGRSGTIRDSRAVHFCRQTKFLAKSTRIAEVTLFPKLSKLPKNWRYICNESIFLVREKVLFGMFYIYVLFPINTSAHLKLISLVNIIKGLNKILQNSPFHRILPSVG